MVAAFLEGTPLPADLEAYRHGAPEHAIAEPSPRHHDEPKETPSLLDTRQNVFDDDPLDFSKLRIGKNRSISPSCLSPTPTRY